MPKKLAPQPLRIVRMQTAQGDETGRDDPLDKIVQTIKQKHDDVERYDNTIEFSTGKIQYTFRMEKIKNFIVSTTVIKYIGDYKINNIIDDYESSFNLFDSTSPNMPSNVLSTFIIFVLPQQSEHQSEGLVEQFSQHLGKTNLGIGITRGCLLSIFETDKEDQFNRTYLISPLNDRGPPDKLIDDMLDDVKKLVVYTAELSRLYSGCVTFFSALKPGEREISEKTEDLLWKLIGPETVDLGTLESGLGYIMERESSLSAMISTMQMNRIEAESIVSKIEYTFMRMDERRVENNPMNLEMEAETYRKISKSFEDYITRSEALKARLATVNENVRTYLNIQQQKMTMDEQKASREQLIRLVNLQEIFHKVEIFIVAVYMTEMARIIFEAVAEEEALMLTVIFIPVALIMAVGISRLLHREKHDL